jgi:hypothetical protein
MCIYGFLHLTKEMYEHDVVIRSLYISYTKYRMHQFDFINIVTIELILTLIIKFTSEQQKFSSSKIC